jgi:hypothetical protein
LKVRLALHRDGKKIGEPSSKNPCKNKASDAVRPLLQLVDRPECHAHRIYLPDFLELRPNPKVIQNAELRQKYLENNLSVQQLAD